MAPRFDGGLHISMNHGNSNERWLVVGCILAIACLLVILGLPMVNGTSGQFEMTWVDAPVAGETRDVEVEGDYAYVCASSGLMILDISKPENPRQVSFLGLQGITRAVVVADDLAYVANGYTDLQGYATIQVIDVSEPHNPTNVGTFEFDGNAQRLALKGDHLYLADYEDQLRVLDISEPTQPEEVASLGLVNNAFDITIVDELAYLAVDEDGIVIVNISDPTDPFKVSDLDSPGEAYGVAADGEHAYLAADWKGLRVIDVSDPEEPEEIGNGNYSVDKAHVVGDHVYTVGGSGLHIYDVSDPTAIERIGELETPDPPAGLDVVGEFAYVADYFSFMIIDVSTPTTPALIGQYNTTGHHPERLAVQGNYAYLTEGYSGLHILNMTPYGRPAETVTFDTPSSARGITVQGTRAYVADLSSLRIFDISEPMAPKELGYYDNASSIRDVEVKGDFAYVGSRYGFFVVDISDPAAPAEVYRHEGYGYDQVAVSGVHAYTVSPDTRAFCIFDITDPLNISYHKYDSFVRRGNDIEVMGDRAYVAQEYGLAIIDVSDPEDPTMLNQTYLDSDGRAIEVSSLYAFLLTQDRGLYIYNITDPESPSLENTARPGGLDVVVTGNLVYLVSSSSLLTVYSVPINENQAPEATIVAISHGTVKEGESVYFEGHGHDSDGYLVAYQWISSIDGVIGDQPALSTNELSPGTHSITFRVQDANGIWSESDPYILKVEGKADGPTDNDYRILVLVVLIGAICAIILVWRSKNPRAYESTGLAERSGKQYPRAPATTQQPSPSAAQARIPPPSQPEPQAPHMLDPKTVTIQCPSCQSRMQVFKLGKLQQIKCESCGTEGELEI